jgi:hypothetical protein
MRIFTVSHDVHEHGEYLTVPVRPLARSTTSLDRPFAIDRRSLEYEEITKPGR